MTYAARETSVDSGSPIELYEFRLGVNYWRLTSGSLDVVYLGNTFSPEIIERGRIEQRNDVRRGDLTITLPRDALVAQNFTSSPPSAVMFVNVYEQHLGDSEVVPIWGGRVLNAKWRESVVELKCESILLSLLRVGPRRVFQVGCPYALYDLDCKVNAVLFRVNGTVSTVTGATVRVPQAAGQPDGWFSGGFMQWTHNNISELRMIDSHVGDILNLLSVPLGLAVTESVYLFPGCQRSLNVCNSKFSNSVNYGGFPYKPKKTPFGGKTLF